MQLTVNKLKHFAYIWNLFNLFNSILLQETQKPDCKPLPSLVVCPPTLTGHWIYEVEKFVNKCYLNPIHYTGPPAERIK